MTLESKRTMLKTMTGETDTDVLSTYLELAADKVLTYAYPMGIRPSSIPSQYEMIQIEIAAFMLNKRGAEGETAHTENGITRHYDGGDIPLSIIRRITPYAEVL